jgi:hypothetical protein
MNGMKLACAVTVTVALAGCNAPGGGPVQSETTEASLLAAGCAHVPPSAPVDLFIQKKPGTCFGLHLQWQMPITVATGRTCGPIRSYEIFLSSDQALNSGCVQPPNPQFDTRSLGVVSGSQTSFDTTAFDPGNQFFTVRAITDAGAGPFAAWQGPVCAFCSQ